MKYGSKDTVVKEKKDITDGSAKMAHDLFSPTKLGYKKIITYK
jgi:hypothetical protein